jgi:outer membrane protein assembly factor BamB
MSSLKWMAAQRIGRAVPKCGDAVAPREKAARSASTGEALGERPNNHEKHNLATPTPVSDGKRIYAWFGNGQVVALDMKGQELWKRHLAREYGSFLNLWGRGNSPAL